MGKVYCEVCKKRCKGNVLKVNEKYFHKDCFTCSDCKCSLKTGGFFMKNDKYYCQKDYQKISTPRCKICGEVLVGDIVSALSYSFHKGCFLCSHCKTPFSPGNRVTIWKDEFYCVCCSQTVCARQSSIGCKSRPTSPFSLKEEQQRHNGNGLSSTTVPKQPLKQAQQQNQNQPTHRLSFADHPSPISFAESGSGTENNGGRTVIEIVSVIIYSTVFFCEISTDLMIPDLEAYEGPA
ncbi:unnamed protein product [Rodentolepis nana]|uniref:LIM zinc-binding domain-containing protein n=1 Tax=Rodentolepis nana TaxID=102285 RepID=A0A0R3TW32_RODNA|nr:unnamed protein product [Rodentolepis nana]